MNDSDRKTRQQDELLTRLLSASGRGPTASPEARARIYAAVQEHWRAALDVPADAARLDAAGDGRAATVRPIGEARRAAGSARRRRSSLVPRLALAASIAAAAIVVYRLQAPAPGPAAAFAAVANVDGSVEVRRDDVARPAGPGGLGSVRIGDVLATGRDGRVALELPNGQALRLDSGTEVMILAESRVELGTGKAYFDSAGLSDTPLVIDTRFGSVRHTGTQFETGLDTGALRIRVREGAVLFRDDGRELTASAGEQVEIGGAGAPRRSSIAPDDPAWRWIEDLAALPAADDYRLGEVLGWIARETGHALEYESATVETRAQDVVLYELAGLNPRQALDVIERTTAFGYVDAGTVLRVTETAR